MLPISCRVLGPLALVSALGCDSNVDVATGGGGQGGAGGPGGTGSMVTGSTKAGNTTGAMSTSGQTTGSMTTDAVTTGSMTTGVSSSTGTMVCASNTPCQECVSMACPDYWCSCVENPECAALFQCFQGCSDQMCTQACLAQFPNGISDAVLITDCAADPCGASCPNAGEPISECEECLYVGCSAEMNACVSQPDCTGLWGCIANCPQFDLTCQQDCYDAYPTGAEPLEELFACADPACGDVCN